MRNTQRMFKSTVTECLILLVAGVLLTVGCDDDNHIRHTSRRSTYSQRQQRHDEPGSRHTQMSRAKREYNKDLAEAEDAYQRDVERAETDYHKNLNKAEDKYQERVKKARRKFDRARD